MLDENKTLAPVAIFVYNRLANTKEVVEALQKNTLASKTDVFIFSDAPKTDRNVKAVGEVREYLKTILGFKSVTIIERSENFYIERNITEGVTEIINKYGKIIVLEDDGVTAKTFLTFMNDALNFYEKHQKVMQIATFTFIPMPLGFNKTFLWRYPESTGGGWATWKRAWDKFVWFQNEKEGLSALSTEQKNIIELDGTFKCLDSLKLNPIPWDICWYIAIIRNQGLSVNSPRALIRNNGLFSGTHFSGINRILGKSPFEIELSDTNEKITFEENLVEDPKAIARLQEFYAAQGKRKRDKALHYFVRFLVIIGVTKLLKKILR